jgi:hypothetical protein
MNQIESLEYFNSCTEVKTIAEIDYGDLEKLITKVFRSLYNPNLPYYEIVCEEEWGNYEKHSFNLQDKNWNITSWEDIEESLKNGKWKPFTTQNLLFKLVEWKYIPACELIVDVYW